MVLDIGRVGIWTGAFDGHPTARIREAAQEVEALGFPTLWIPEGVGRDPFVTAGLLLSATSRLRLATGIANVYARDATATLAAEQTLAEAFPGRFLLGLGVSSPVLVENVRKHHYGKPLSYMKAYLTAMDQALYRAPKPNEDPERVLAALGPKMLETSARQANGAHPYLTTPDHTHTAQEILGPEPLLAPEQMVVLDTDTSAARAVGRAAIGFYLRAPGYLANLRRMGFNEDDFGNPKAASDRMVDAIVARGDLEAVCRRVREHHDAGADHVCVQVLRPDQELPIAEWRDMADALL